MNAVLSRDEARALTEEVKADARALWAKMGRLYAGQAHKALGFSSWGEFCGVEFDLSAARAYQLLDAARVMSALDDSTVVERPSSEAVARELAPLRDDPDAIREAFGQAVEVYGPKPTAAQVREIVRPPKQDHRFEAPEHALRIVVAAIPKPEDALWPVDEQGDVEAVRESLDGLHDWVRRARRSFAKHEKALAAMRRRERQARKAERDRPRLRAVDAA